MKTKKKELIPALTAAKMLGITHQTFYNGVKSGRFTPSGRKPSGKPLFDFETVKKQYDLTRPLAEAQDHAKIYREASSTRREPEKRTDISASSDDAVNLTNSAIKTKIRKDRAMADTAEFKLAVKRGEYMHVEDVRRLGMELGTVIMGSLQAWPARLAPELASMKDGDEHDFNIRLEQEVNDLIVNIRKKCGYEE